MILKFNDFYNKNDNGFDYVNEKLTVSMDVNSATDMVVKFIENFNGDKNVVESDDVYDVIKFKKNPKISVFGCECKLDLTIYDVANDVDVDVVDSVLNDNDFGARIYSNYNTLNGIVNISFKIEGNILMKNGIISDRSRTVISHELRHAYEQSMIYNGLPEVNRDKIMEISKKWRMIYRASMEYVRLCKTFMFVKLVDNPTFCKILYTIYCCDVSEISAFTQEAYESCKDCKSKNEVKNKICKTGLYRLMQLFSQTIDMIESKEVQDIYNENKKKYKFDYFPTIHNLLKLITKRYMKARTNYGKVFALICGRFDKNEGLDLIDVKY